MNTTYLNRDKLDREAVRWFQGQVCHLGINWDPGYPHEWAGNFGKYGYRGWAACMLAKAERSFKMAWKFDPCGDLAMSLLMESPLTAGETIFGRTILGIEGRKLLYRDHRHPFEKRWRRVVLFQRWARTLAECFASGRGRKRVAA